MKKCFLGLMTILTVAIVNVNVASCSKDDEESGGSESKTDIHEWVDLGLPSGTLWATCNVGAEKPEDYGDFFAWGETVGYKGGKKNFSWSTYKYCEGTDDTMTKYCISSSYGVVDNKKELEPSDDAASANWGSNWRMPTGEEFDELINNSYTITEWITVNGVNGRKITSKSTGNSIFLPAAGFRYGTSLDNTGSDGNYWSRSLGSGYSFVGYVLYFSSGSIGASYYFRFLGRSVRPVRVQQ